MERQIGAAERRPRDRAPPRVTTLLCPGLELGQELRSLGSELRARGALRAANPGEARASHTTPGRGENSFIAFTGCAHPRGSPRRRRGEKPEAEARLSSAPQQQEWGGGGRRGAAAAAPRAALGGARGWTALERECAPPRAPSLSQVRLQRPLASSWGRDRPTSRSLATAPLKKPMAKVLLSKCT
jgi:hypothetical protein